MSWKPGRRVVLLGAAGAAVAAGFTALAGRATSGAGGYTALSARFVVPGALEVQFDYQDPLHFRLTPAVGAAATCVDGGRIVLHVPASLANAGRAQWLWVGTMVPLPSTPPRSRFLLQPSTLPVQSTSAWALSVPVQDVTVPSGGPTVVLSVAAHQSLAAAQYVVGTTLRASMDMNLCGDGVNSLLANWPAAVTGQGLAVFASSNGVRLADQVQVLSGPLRLPAIGALEDYRLKRRG